MTTTILTPSTGDKDNRSLRTTIPIFIVDQLKLKVGDRLEWRLETHKNEPLIVAVPKKKQ